MLLFHPKDIALILRAYGSTLGWFSKTLTPNVRNTFRTSLSGSKGILGWEATFSYCCDGKFMRMLDVCCNLVLLNCHLALATRRC